jgi:hypothetical protein
MQLSSLKRSVDFLIYLSVALGILLLFQLHSLVPSWLFYSVLIGWGAYLIVALAIATHHDAAYPVALLLAVLTLIVSLPQPEHYSYVQAGLSLASATFAAGSVLQIALLVLIPLYLLRKRKTRL